MQQKKKNFTFAGGPTMAPDFLKQALDSNLFDPNQSLLLNYNSNTKQYKDIQLKTQQNLRELLNIPSDYHIWFTAGGVHLQFAGIAMNFAGDNNAVANYCTTGYFSKLAQSQAKKLIKTNIVVDMTKNQQGLFTLPKQYNFVQNACYTHFVDNQTVQGLQYPDQLFPFQNGVPLLDDCSSSLLTKPIDWNKVSMAYAHAQKNCGISGITIMIVKDQFVKKTKPIQKIPDVINYQNYLKNNGYPYPINASSIFSVLKMTQNLIQNGGINSDRFKNRAKKIYNVLDKYQIYLPKVVPQFRSRINLTWQTKSAQMNQKLISEGIQNGLYQFKGHRTVGGFRASCFNPVSDEGVQKLAQFLDQFGKKYQNL